MRSLSSVAVRRRRACHTMRQEHRRHQRHLGELVERLIRLASIQMTAPVVTITAPGPDRRPDLHTRKPYRSVRLTQMKWNGTVSHSGTQEHGARFASEKSTHATSNQRTRLGHSEPRQAASMRYPTPRTVAIDRRPAWRGAGGRRRRRRSTRARSGSPRPMTAGVPSTPFGPRCASARAAAGTPARRAAPARRPRRPPGGSGRARAPAWPGDGGRPRGASAAGHVPERAARRTRTVCESSPRRRARALCTFDAVSFSAERTSTDC